MASFTIRLGPDLELGSKEVCHRMIQDVYATKYLEELGVLPTFEGKLKVLQHAPLSGLSIDANWNDSGICSLRLRPKTMTKAAPVSGEFSFLSSMPVAPPEPVRFVGRARPTSATSLRRERREEALRRFLQDGVTTDHESFVEELECMRGRGPAPVADSEGLEAELGDLRRFILPFACERADATVVPWQSLEVGFPVASDFAELLEPITTSLEEIQADTESYVRRLPLELLTTRGSPEFFAAVRAQAAGADLARLTGLLAHWLYWTLCGPLHKPAQRLPDSSMQSLLVTIQESWEALTSEHRGSPIGVSFVLPVLLLVMKRGVELVFHNKYARVFAVDRLGSAVQDLVDQINISFVTLFDPDAVLFSFGALDASKQAIRLWRKLSVLTQSEQDPTKRRLCRMARTSRALRSALGEAEHASDARTRSLLARSTSAPLLQSDGVRDPGRPSRCMRHCFPLDERRRVAMRQRTRLRGMGRVVERRRVSVCHHLASNIPVNS